MKMWPAGDHQTLTTGSTRRVVPWRPADVALGAGILIIAAIVIMAPAIAIGAVVAGGLGQIDNSTPAAVLVLTAGIALEVSLVAIALKFSVAKYDCSWRDLGFRRPRKGGLWLPFAVIIGTYVIQAIYFLVVVLTGLYKVFPEAGTDTGPTADTAVVLPLFIISVLLFAPLAEEIFFRGFAFAGFRTRWGGFLAAIASGLLFSVVHLNVALIIPLAGAGILLAWSYSYSDSLYPSIAAHFLLNAVFVGLNFGGETVGIVIGVVVAIAMLAAIWTVAPAALAATMARRRNRGPVFWAIAASIFTWPAVATLWLTGSRKPSMKRGGVGSGLTWLLGAFGAVLLLLIVGTAIVSVSQSDDDYVPSGQTVQSDDAGGLSAEPPEEAPLGPGHTLGLRCGYASRFLRERYDLPPDKGCVVLRVSSPGSAERAGFQIGDKIIGLDGRPITSGRQFTFLFEELPGIQQHREFVVQRGDEELRLDVELADRAELPDEDPYFFYLRAKADTELRNYEQVIADYTKAIELESGFDLAYLYRGITYMEEDVEAAQADILRALELDPELTEAHRALAQMAQRENNPEEALLFIEESLQLNECGHPLEEWDIDCAEDVVFRTGFLFLRLEEGDDLLIEQEVDRVENVVFFEPSVAYSRFRLAYLRGGDDLARDLGEVFVFTPLNRLFADLQSEQSRVQNMLGAGSEIHTYSMWPWPTGRLVEVQFHEPELESPEGLRKTSDGKLVKTLLLFELPKPDRFREAAVAWELFHGSYRLASYSTPSAWGEDWLVEFGLMVEPPPGLYELRVYVKGEPFGVTQMDFP